MPRKTRGGLAFAIATIAASMRPRPDAAENALNPAYSPVADVLQ